MGSRLGPRLPPDLKFRIDLIDDAKTADKMSEHTRYTDYVWYRILTEFKLHCLCSIRG